MSSFSNRLSRHQILSQYLPAVSQVQMLQCLAKAETTEGWGVNHVCRFKEIPVFVKRIPLTTQEYARAFDTSNHFQLPMYYHYGVGSAGFGAFRELATHIKCSQWVLHDQHRGFPLLYHYRVLPTSRPWKQRSEAGFQKHLAFWHQNEKIAHYLKQRAQAPYEIMLFLEYFPHTLYRLSREEPMQTLDLLLQADQSLQFLNQQGVLHLDAHLANLLSDGTDAYVSDFGLALDRQFALDAEETRFFEQHRAYDRAELLGCLNILWMQAVQSLSPEDQARFEQVLGVTNEAPLPQRLRAFFNHLQQPEIAPCIEQLWPSTLREFAFRHQQALLHTADFFEDLYGHSRQDTHWTNPAIPAVLR